MNQSDIENSAREISHTPVSIYSHGRLVGAEHRDQCSLLIPDGWPAWLDDSQRSWMQRFGSRLLALLLQYNGRADGGEGYLEEGKRIAGSFGQHWAQSGCSLPETLQAFLVFRRAVLEAIFETSHLSGSGEDEEGWRLFQRTNDFLDTLMLSLIDKFHLKRTQQNGRNEQ